MCDVAAVECNPWSPARPGGAFSLWAAARVSGSCRNLQTVKATRIVGATLVTAIKPAMVPAHGDWIARFSDWEALAWPLTNGPDAGNTVPIRLCLVRSRGPAWL